MKKLLSLVLGSLTLGLILTTGCATDPSAIKINKPISMPLFYDNGGIRATSNSEFTQERYFPKKNVVLRYFSEKNLKAGNIAATWDYLSKSEAGKKKCREEIKATTKSGEIPAITFLISRNGESGPLGTFPNITDDQINQAKEMIKELVEEGIAVFPCLYVDDPSGSIPKWWEIEKHMNSWIRVNNGIKKYVTGYILSIETNEKANSKNHIEGSITAMRAYMAGVDYYGTHMEFGKRGRYTWTGGGTTPNNADIIILELWDPHKGDAMGLNGVKNRYNHIKPRVGILRLIWQEWNLNPNGSINKQQREWLKSKKEWGVG